MMEIENKLFIKEYHIAFNSIALSKRLIASSYFFDLSKFIPAALNKVGIIYFEITYVREPAPETTIIIEIISVATLLN
ncbi:MAG: hypothetical protein Q8900_09570 [Bacillota bacterium]|nr:hypothetical protein [Bacillota bacterium]